MTSIYDTLSLTLDIIWLKRYFLVSVRSSLQCENIQSVSHTLSLGKIYLKDLIIFVYQKEILCPSPLTIMHGSTPIILTIIILAFFYQTVLDYGAKLPESNDSSTTICRPNVNPLLTRDKYPGYEIYGPERAFP